MKQIPEFLLKNAFDWSHLRGDEVYVWRNLHNCWITKLEYLKKDDYDIWRYRKRKHNLKYYNRTNNA